MFSTDGCWCVSLEKGRGRGDGRWSIVVPQVCGHDGVGGIVGGS